MITTISLILAAIIIGGALWVAGIFPASKSDSANPNSTITQAELAAHDGINGHECYVAVDGTVYLIKGFALWEMGRHSSSNGKAKCGEDESQVILESAHGKSKLQLLKVVGKLQG